MFGECCFKCRLYHNEYNNIGEYVNRDVCWRCRCHRNNNKKNKKRQINSDRKSEIKFEKDSKGEGEGGDDKINYYKNYHECDQEGECGNINCSNNKHTPRPTSYRVKKGYEPYIESLKRNQMTFQVKLIPCTELFQSFRSRHIFTDQIIENLRATYSERKDLNHAVVDLLLMYGEKYVYRFSRSLKDGGQIELHELLEDEAEKIKEEKGFYEEKSDTEEQSADFYGYRSKSIEDDEKVLERVLERSKTYRESESSRINDSWALLLDLENKDNQINQLNKINIENEQRMREMRERLKCRGRQMDEDRQKYTQHMQVQIKHNDSAERTIVRLEEQLREYDTTLDDLRERAIENIKTPSSSGGNEDRMLYKRRSRSFHDSLQIKELPDPDVIGFMYDYGEMIGRGDESETNQESAVSDYELEENKEKYGELVEDKMIRKLSLKSPEKLANVMAYLIEGNKRRVLYEREISEFTGERRRVMQYMVECLSEDGDGEDESGKNFGVVFRAFKEQNDAKLKNLHELETKMGSVEGRLNETMSENKQIHDVKKQAVQSLEMTRSRALKLNMEKSFLKGVILSMRSQASKNDRKLFPYVNTVTTRPYVENDF